MEEVKMTQEELDAKIKEEVEKAKAEQEAELKKKHDSEMAQLRISAKEEKEKAIKKAQEEANLTAEEKAKKALEEKEKQAEEERKAERQELEQLRFEKKVNDRSKKLKEAGLPTELFEHNIDLINAKDDEVDNVIADLKEKFSKVAPKFATIDTNVHGAGGNPISPEQAELERVRHLGLGK